MNLKVWFALFVAALCGLAPVSAVPDDERPRRGTFCVGGVSDDETTHCGGNRSKEVGEYFSLVRITRGTDKPRYTVRLRVYERKEEIDIVLLDVPLVWDKMRHIKLESVDSSLAAGIFGQGVVDSREHCTSYHLRDASCMAQDFYFDLRFDGKGLLNQYRIRSVEISAPCWVTVKKGTTHANGWFSP